MLLDVIALQALYGANATHAAGDDVYDILNLTKAVWDTGGNDTFLVPDSNGTYLVIDRKPCF